MARSSGAGRAMVYAVVVLLASRPPSGVDGRRWLDPCGGARPVETGVAGVDAERNEELDALFASVTVDLTSLLRSISDRSLSLKRRVVNLKNLYVSQRRRLLLFFFHLFRFR